VQTICIANFYTANIRFCQGLFLRFLKESEISDDTDDEHDYTDRKSKRALTGLHGNAALRGDGLKTDLEIILG
jgi:hypothetical protein